MLRSLFKSPIFPEEPQQDTQQEVKQPNQPNQPKTTPKDTNFDTYDWLGPTQEEEKGNNYLLYIIIFITGIILKKRFL